MFHCGEEAARGARSAAMQAHWDPSSTKEPKEGHGTPEEQQVAYITRVTAKASNCINIDSRQIWKDHADQLESVDSGCITF